MRAFAVLALLSFAVPAIAQEVMVETPVQGGSFFSNLFSRPAPETQQENLQGFGFEDDGPRVFGQEPTLQQIILSEIHDYPKPLDELDLKHRKRCLERLEVIFDQALEDGYYPIPREEYWLDVYPRTGMRIYFCDGSILKEYEDDNREIPSRWYSVRNSLTEFLNPLH